jgi:hypothetical protein
MGQRPQRARPNVCCSSAVTDWAQEIEAVRPVDFGGVVWIGATEPVEWEHAYGRACQCFCVRV